MNRRSQNSSPENRAGMIVLLLFFLFGLLVLIPLFPPFGLLWCGVLAVNMGAQRKKAAGADRKDADAGRLYPVRNGRPGRNGHRHDPISYSYDRCAVEKRLEQLDVLRDAGLLDASEYKTRRQEILSMR